MNYQNRLQNSQARLKIQIQKGLRYELSIMALSVHLPLNIST
jgi:hypothetical protein